MYLSNLVAVIKSESDSKIIVSINNRHAYQANRSYILNRIKNCIVHLFAVALVHMLRDDMPDSGRSFQNMSHYPP